MFLKGGRLDGCHALLMGGLRELEIFGREGGLTGWARSRSYRPSPFPELKALIVAEGYATGRTLERATGLPVAVAFTSGNLIHVAQAFRERYPDLYIIVAGDNDHRKPLEKEPDGRPKKNTGKEAAEIAAAAVGGYPLLPSFTTHERGTDWNDFEHLRGREAALASIRDGVTLALVQIDARRAAAGLLRCPVHPRDPGLERPSGPELGYVVAPTLEEARNKLRRGEWVATQNRTIISLPQIEVFEPHGTAIDHERADAQRTIERDRLRLVDAGGESVAETLRSNEATAQRAETPVQARAALDRMREAAEGEADRQSMREQHRARRHSRAR